MRPFLCLLVRLYIIGHSEVDVSRTNAAAVSLQGPMNWDGCLVLNGLPLADVAQPFLFLFLFLFLFHRSSLALCLPCVFS